MAQTNTKYREVYGTEAKYKANPTKYANDKYICTDTGVMYVKGKRVAAYEADLKWGGGNWNDNAGVLDTALMDKLRANRFAFMPPAAVEVEYSRDAGGTWTDYEATDAQKTMLFSGQKYIYDYVIGKNTTPLNEIESEITKYRLRVTIDTLTGNVYANLRKIILYVSTSGCSNCWITIETKSHANVSAGKDVWVTQVNKAAISGRGGWNVINGVNFITYTFNDLAGTAMQKVRFTFGCDGVRTGETDKGLVVSRIYGIGPRAWTFPSNMAESNSIYHYDEDQNALFPAGVSATKFYGAGVKDATSVSHTNMATEREKVPCMGFLSYWNGAFQSNGASNLRYCAKGAFGNLAVKDNLPIDNGANKSDCLQYMQTASEIVDKPGSGGSWYHIIKMNHGTGDTYYKNLIAFGFGSYRPMVNRAVTNGVLKDWKTLALTDDIPTSPSSLKGTLYCDPSTGEFHCAGMDDDFAEAPLASVKEKLEIPTIYSLTIKGSAGNLNATFDPDSAAKVIDITPASIGAATATGLSSLAADVAENQEAIDILSTNLNTPANDTKDGYMSSEQAVKLAGIEEGANKYVHPAYTARTGYPTANATPGFGSTFSVSQIVTDAKGHVTAANTRTVKIPNTVATTSAAGLMSADDKRKLESIGGSCYIHIQTIIDLQNGSSFNGYGFYTSASQMIHAIIDAMKEGKKITFTNVTKSQLDDYLGRENQNDGAGFFLLNAEFCMYESQTATTGRIFMRRAVYENPVSGTKIEFNKSSSSSTFTNIKVTSF